MEGAVESVELFSDFMGLFQFQEEWVWIPLYIVLEYQVLLGVDVGEFFLFSLNMISCIFRQLQKWVRWISIGNLAHLLGG